MSALWIAAALVACSGAQTSTGEPTASTERPALRPGDADAAPTLEALPSLDVATSRLSLATREGMALAGAILSDPPPEVEEGDTPSTSLPLLLGSWWTRRLELAESAISLLDHASDVSARDRVVASAVLGLLHEGIDEGWNEGEASSPLAVTMLGSRGPRLDYDHGIAADNAYRACELTSRDAARSLSLWGAFCSARRQRLDSEEAPRNEDRLPRCRPAESIEASLPALAGRRAVQLRPDWSAPLFASEREALRAQIQRSVAPSTNPAASFLTPAETAQADAVFAQGRSRELGPVCRVAPPRERVFRQALGGIGWVTGYPVCAADASNCALLVTSDHDDYEAVGRVAASRDLPGTLDTAAAALDPDGDFGPVAGARELATHGRVSLYGVIAFGEPATAAQTTLTATLPDIASCVDDDTPGGIELALALEVTTAGRVQRVEVLADPASARTVADCMEQLLRPIRVARPRGARQRMRVGALLHIHRQDPHFAVEACNPTSDDRIGESHPALYEAGFASQSEHCYRDQLPSGDADASLLARLTIAADGSVTEVETWLIATPTAETEDGRRQAYGFRDCIDAALLTTSWPCTEDGAPHELTVDLHFGRRP